MIQATWIFIRLTLVNRPQTTWGCRILTRVTEVSRSPLQDQMNPNRRRPFRKVHTLLSDFFSRITVILEKKSLSTWVTWEKESSRKRKIERERERDVNPCHNRCILEGEGGVRGSLWWGEATAAVWPALSASTGGIEGTCIIKGKTVYLSHWHRNSP